jgi:hypothetical protein
MDLIRDGALGRRQLLAAGAGLLAVPGAARAQGKPADHTIRIAPTKHEIAPGPA